VNILIIPYKNRWIIAGIEFRNTAPAREDTRFGEFCDIKGITQYVITTKIKGHNYHHPLKRTNTENSRRDKQYTEYEWESIKTRRRFIKKLRNS